MQRIRLAECPQQDVLNMFTTTYDKDNFDHFAIYTTNTNTLDTELLLPKVQFIHPTHVIFQRVKNLDR